MTTEIHPCADGLSLECFRTYPKWAKMRFAHKLLGTLFPAEITKRLPLAIQQAMTQMPPDWPEGQDLTPALLLTPPAGISLPPGGPISPTYCAPFSAGPPSPPAGKNPEPETGPWFYDKFTTLDLSVWTEDNYGVGTNTIDAGRLKQYTAASSQASLHTANDATIPAAFDLTFELTYSVDAGYFYAINVYTGEGKLWIAFDPPNYVFLNDPIGHPHYTVDNFLGTTDTWKLSWNGTTCSLYRNGAEIAAGVLPPYNTDFKGRIQLTAKNGPTIFLDELKIQAA